MSQGLAPSFDVLARVPWLEVLRTLATLATAFIAFLALRNWQRQDRAKRQAEFLDALVDAMHTYVVEMQKPISLLHSSKIGMASHVRSWEDGEEDDKALRGAIAYIDKRGEEDGKRLASALAAVEASIIKLRSLTAKGQVFRFGNYAKCQCSVDQLTWQFNRILSFQMMIDSPTWNWENPEVRGLLTKVTTIEPDAIRSSIGENEIAVVEFARESYQRLYG